MSSLTLSKLSKAKVKGRFGPLFSIRPDERAWSFLEPGNIVSCFCKSFPEWPAIFLAVLLVIAGCTTAPNDFFQGYVEGEYQLISSPLAGQLQILSVSRSMSVASGDPLFVLEHKKEAAEVSEEEHARQRAEDNLRDLTKGLRPAEIAAVRARLVQAEAAAKLARKEFDRREKLFRGNAISGEELDRARKEMESTKAAVLQARAELKTASLGARSDTVLAARAELKAAVDRLAQARWRLKQKTQKAPTAGLVFDTFYVTGEFVPAGSPVVSILPPGNIKIRFFVPETVVGTLSVGRRISISFDGAKRAYQGTISFISPQAEYTPPVIYSRNTRSKLVFMVEATVPPNQAIALHPGQPVDVRLESPHD